MPVPARLPGESLSQFAIRVAYLYGHFWGPDNPNGWNVKQLDLKNLSITDPVVVQALRSLSLMDPERYAGIVVQHHMRPPDFDGQFGPAMQEFIQLGRCPIPDNAPPPGVVFSFDDPDLQQVVERMQAQPAIGSGGNWAGCHNIGQFHCAAMRVNPAGMNPRVVPLWKQIMMNVRQMYSGIGLLWKFIDMDGVDLLTGEQFNGTIQTDLTFVPRSDGWIGLAIVTRNEGCSSKIWLKLLSTFLGGNTDLEIIIAISALLAHEGGHNCGLSHTNGGVMSPVLQHGLPVGVWPENDPSTPILRQLYGGVPVPIPGGGDIPVPAPPVGTLEKRVENLELQSRIQQAMTKALAEMIGKMRNQ